MIINNEPPMDNKGFSVISVLLLVHYCVLLLYCFLFQMQMQFI